MADMHRLKGLRAYLAGPIDNAADDGVPWRIEMTKFLEKGKIKGAKIKNGLEMLYLQAELSWGYWNKK